MRRIGTNIPLDAGTGAKGVRRRDLRVTGRNQDEAGRNQLYRCAPGAAAGRHTNPWLVRRSAHSFPLTSSIPNLKSQVSNLKSQISNLKFLVPIPSDEIPDGAKRAAEVPLDVLAVAFCRRQDPVRQARERER